MLQNQLAEGAKRHGMIHPVPHLQRRLRSHLQTIACLNFTNIKVATVSLELILDIGLLIPKQTSSALSWLRNLGSIFYNAHFSSVPQYLTYQDGYVYAWVFNRYHAGNAHGLI